MLLFISQDVIGCVDCLR